MYHLRELSNHLNPALVRAHRLLQTQTRLHTSYEMSRDFLLMRYINLRLLTYLLLTAGIFNVILSLSVAVPLTNARNAMAWLT